MYTLLKVSFVLIAYQRSSSQGATGLPQHTNMFHSSCLHFYTTFLPRRLPPFCRSIQSLPSLVMMHQSIRIQTTPSADLPVRIAVRLGCTGSDFPILALNYRPPHRKVSCFPSPVLIYNPPHRGALHLLPSVFVHSPSHQEALCSLPSVLVYSPSYKEALCLSSSIVSLQFVSLAGVVPFALSAGS